MHKLSQTLLVQLTMPAFYLQITVHLYIINSYSTLLGYMTRNAYSIFATLNEKDGYRKESAKQDY